MTLPQWEHLKCECGSDEFMEVKYINHHPTGGTSYQLARVKCAKCNSTLDIRKLVERLEFNRKKDELDRMQKEIDLEGGNDATIAASKIQIQEGN